MPSATVPGKYATIGAILDHISFRWTLPLIQYVVPETPGSLFPIWLSIQLLGIRLLAIHTRRKNSDCFLSKNLLCEKI
jgi:hypothetical protein